MNEKRLPTEKIGQVRRFGDGWCVDLGDDDNAWGFADHAEAEHFAAVYTGVVRKFTAELDALRAADNALDDSANATGTSRNARREALAAALAGEVVKTFNHANRSWAIVRRGGRHELMRVAKDGALTPAIGTERTSREAYRYAARKWPEYCDEVMP